MLMINYNHFEIGIKIWSDSSTCCQFYGIIIVVYFFPIQVSTNCWSIMSNCAIYFEGKKRKSVYWWPKVFRFNLKECSLHIQLILSFNFELDHQFSFPYQLTFDDNWSSVHHYLFKTVLHQSMLGLCIVSRYIGCIDTLTIHGYISFLCV